jgi:carbamoyl-phosphate synthase small subunit
VFEGVGFGAMEPSVGEIVFNTSMSGYQEIITDPSYAKQIIAFTHPHIGNTGINDEDNESDSIFASGIVIKDLPNHYSNWRATQSLESFLLSKRTIGISNIDTRALTSKLRDHGSLKACIAPGERGSLSSAKEALNQFGGLEGLDLAKEVSTKHSFSWDEGTWPNYQDVKNEKLIVAIDFGVKKNIIRCLNERNCLVKVFPYNVTLTEIQSFKPDGIMLSNGPGDPEPFDGINLAKSLIDFGKIPMFGICLGHQVIAIANGISTFKMHNGHRGINHPVKNLKTGLCEITSQNHGFGVNEDDIKKNKNVEVTHINLNDGTIEGIKLINKDCFSVQYHPESSPGPHDSRYLFDDFIHKVSKR